MEPQIIIARRIARAFLRDARESRHWNSNIGSNYVPEGLQVFFQSENGLIGTGSPPEDGMGHPTLTDAGGRPVTALRSQHLRQRYVVRPDPWRSS